MSFIEASTGTRYVAILFLNMKYSGKCLAMKRGIQKFCGKIIQNNTLHNSAKSCLRRVHLKMYVEQWRWLTDQENMIVESVLQLSAPLMNVFQDSDFRL